MTSTNPLRSTTSTNLADDHPFSIFRSRFWGNQTAFDKVVEEGSLEIPPPLAASCRLFSGAPPYSLYLREEYELLYTHLESLYAPFSRGVVVSGSPGIGKSLFNLYALARRLAAGQPTIFVQAQLKSHPHPKYRPVPLVFDADGVFELDFARLETNNDGSFWCLHDSTATGVIPDERLWWTFIVFTVSPDVSRYDLMLKDNHNLWYMNPWSLPEIKAFLKSRKIVFNHHFFRTSGFLLRDYIVIVQSPNQEARRDQVQLNLANACQRIKSIPEFNDAIRGLDDPRLICHRLYALWREVEPYECTASYRSELVKELFQEQLTTLREDEHRAVFQALGKVGITLGDIFEKLACQYLAGHVKHNAMGPFMQFQKKKGRKFSQPHDVQHTFRIRPRSHTSYMSLDSMVVDPNVFYTPADPTNEFFDAIVFEPVQDGVVVWVFQITDTCWRTKGSNLGYRTLKQIQAIAQESIEGEGEVVFKYVLVLPHGKPEPSGASWTFPPDLVILPDKSVDKSADESMNESADESMDESADKSWIPGEAFVLFLDF
ncbi:hypothetical protein VKT23_001556 [Stygiomarasmius scandens]|uniref:Uncharacterized protein n=1 Tax=Marasmiellus scandens TaxID=2682957 RepID=A0ABR1JZ70_9AGAR